MSTQQSIEQEQVKHFELFVGCRGLVGNVEGDNLNTFAVLLLKSDEASPFIEVSRTETIPNCSAPQYCSSSEVGVAESLIAEAAMRVDVYQRKTEQSERVRDHKLLGKATIPVDSLFTSEGNHVSMEISHPSEAEKVGVVTVSMEERDVHKPELKTEIQLDVSAAVLRKKDWNKTVVGQRYELHRAHRHDDCEGRTVWLPICRSNRITKQRDSAALVQFSSVALNYRHVCNGDDERRMRLSIYASGSCSKRDGLVCFVDFTIRDICEMDPTEEVLPLEGYHPDATNLGNVTILRADPTDFGSHFSLQVNHESTLKYNSSVKSGRQVRAKETKKKVRKLARRLSMNIRDRSSSSKRGEESLGSPASTLFSSSFMGE